MRHEAPKAMQNLHASSYQRVEQTEPEQREQQQRL